MKFIPTLFLLLLLFFACGQNKKATAKHDGFSVLVFSKTAGYRHESIPAGQAAISAMGKKHGFTVDMTEDSTLFSPDNLKKYAAVIFLNTTLNVLNEEQQVAFENYIRAGGGYVGIHSAADTEYDWPWYGKLVGGYFESHPPGVHEATVHIVDKKHPATASLPDQWIRTDEWYNYKDLNPETHVLCHLDETTYEGGEMGSPHPITWYHEYDGGRAFYTGFGHTPESFSEPRLVEFLWGGIQYAAGK